MKKCYWCIVLSILLILCSCNLTMAEDIQTKNNYGDWAIGQYVDDFDDPTGESYLYTITTGKYSNTATTNSDLEVIVYYHNGQYAIRLLEYNNTKAVYTSSSEISFKFKIEDEIFTHSLYPIDPPNGDIVINDTSENYAEVDFSDTAAQRLATMQQNRYFDESAASQLTYFLSGGTDIRCVMTIDSSKYSFTISGNGFGDAAFGDTYNTAIQMMESGNYEEALPIFRSMANYRDSSKKADECIEQTYGPLANAIEKIQVEQSLSLSDALALVKADPSFQVTPQSQSFMDKLEILASCEGIYTYEFTLGKKDYYCDLTIEYFVVNGEIQASVYYEAYEGVYSDAIITVYPEDQLYKCRIDVIRDKGEYTEVKMEIWISEEKAVVKMQNSGLGENICIRK